MDLQSGFYMTLLLTVAKAILIAAEIWLDRRHRKPREGRDEADPLPKWYQIFGSVFALVAFILGGLAFLGLLNDRPAQVALCQQADADIVGDGVRAAAWTQVAVLFFIALFGILHTSETAVKEVGGGLIITHVSLAIALLVPLGRGELSSIDGVLGSLILDAQSNSLSILMMTKQALAARWQIGIALLGQTLGLLVEGVIVGSFSAGKLPNDGCECFSVFWWAWFSNCSAVYPNSVVPFWIYIGYRFITLFHGSFFIITRSSLFHRAELWDNTHPCDRCEDCYRDANSDDREPCTCRARCSECDKCNVCQKRNPFHGPDGECSDASNRCIKCGGCEVCGHIKFDAGTLDLLAGERFSDTNSTISSNFLESSVLALLSMVFAEVTMSLNEVEKTSPIYAAGQVTGLVIAAGTAFRALWVFLYMFDWGSINVGRSWRWLMCGHEINTTKEGTNVELPALPRTNGTR
ncbi:hypothetical protein F4778DRAFT_717935 [Xylariomycetidae sp. FL2044]|nr:hypothetical protein F4778DRAFT_717935 [Xylariomycetidae sp. FL2044]